MITNPKRHKRIKEFIDKNHEVMNDYYELGEASVTNAKAKLALKKFIEQDPDFYDPYLDLARLVGGKEGQKLLQQAFERAILRIVDKNGDWPVLMLWGWLENRHLMRVIETWAVVLWDEGKTEDALEIFRRLFHANPDDNQGARHSILALRLGLGTDWFKLFEVTDGPMAGQAIDVIATGKWFDENMRKFSDEFDWWPEALKKLGYTD